MRPSVLAVFVSASALCPLFGALPIPGDAREGEKIFTEQRCITCHSIGGVGGKAAPDLGKRTGRSYTPNMMAALMWNHAPVMWTAMEKQGVEKPRLSRENAADLFAYFYAKRYFDNPGDAGRGKRLFQTKGCDSCHGISDAKAGGGKPVSQWESLGDSIEFSKALWNHSSEMSQAAAQKNLKWPELTSQQMTDLLVFFQNLPEAKKRQASFFPADATTGQKLFELKGCADCHKESNSLENRFSFRSMQDFAAAMWNHAPLMKHHPELNTEEMRRIVGYLWSIQFFEPKGDPQVGRRVFENKRCAMCHENAQSGAPRLAGQAPGTSFEMVSALWHHGPAMLDKMNQQKLRWPRFNVKEMANLVAYLNTLAK